MRNDTQTAQPTEPQSSRPWQLKLAVVWVGELFSMISSSVMGMGLIWHVTVTTGSASMLSLASLVGFLPMALLSAVAGVVVDRVTVKPVLIASDLIIAAVSAALVLFSLAGPLPIWAIMVALFLRAIGNAFYAPAAQALTPLIAPPEHLTRLAGIQQSCQSLGYIAGMAIAAIIYPLFGLTAMIALDVAGALIATGAVLLARIETPRLTDPQAAAAEQPGASQTLAATVRSVLNESLDGLRVLRSHKGLYALLWCGFAFSLVMGPISALFPIMVMGHFGGGTTEAAVVEAAWAVGMIAGGALLAATGGFKNRAISIVAATASFAVSCTVSGLLGSSMLPGFIACSLLMGLGAPWYSGPQVALMQEKIAPEFLGRVFGLYGSITAWAMPAGLVFSTLFADAVGAPLWFLGSGLAALALAAATWAIPSIRKIEQE